MSQAKATATRARYTGYRGDAMREAARALQPFIQARFTMTEQSRRSDDAWENQWVPQLLSMPRIPPNGGWNWPAARAPYKTNYDRFDPAIWAGDRLAALALGVPTANALELLLTESDPRSDCPLSGNRLVIVFEAAARYAQKLGKSELRLRNPANTRLVNIYVTRFGFQYVSASKGNHAYCWKGV